LKIIRAVLLIILTAIVLTACNTSHNNGLFVENNGNRQTLTIQLVQRIASNQNRLVE